MATPGYLQKEVERILQENNVTLTDFMKGDLARIAGSLRAEGLVELATVDKMRMIGVDSFALAAELLTACRPSLVQYPEENLPKFIAVLKQCVTMEKLAEELEDEFKKASMSWYILTLVASQYCYLLDVDFIGVATPI